MPLFKKLRPALCLGWIGLALSAAVTASAQLGYTYWLTGSGADANTQPLPGLLLAGGGPDNDDAMRWLLQRANGGDVVIIRASGADGYNDYLYSELGVSVNSVETIRFDAASAAYDSAVIARIRGAEALFIAGGDQYVYYNYWKDTPIEDAIHYLLHEKRITVGGTSAGMAILGQAYYVPAGASATSGVALANPYHSTLEGVLTDDFIEHPLMQGVITDTHYAQRNRFGRHLVFMGRLALQTNEPVYGIACNEGTAVAITDDGRASVFGEYPAYADFAYFLQTQCAPPLLPEVMQPNSPLTWNQSMAALKVYKAPGTTSAQNNFDLNDWASGSGGVWEHWWANNGAFNTAPGSGPNCTPTAAGEPVGEAIAFSVAPNPAREEAFVRLSGAATPPLTLRLFNALGQPVRQWPGNTLQLNLDNLPNGYYRLMAIWPDRQLTQSLVRQ